jgi:hypothetical protein
VLISHVWKVLKRHGGGFEVVGTNSIQILRDAVGAVEDKRHPQSDDGT